MEKGEPMRLIHKYPGLVERFYTMNPKTEFLMPNGADMEEGMVVLLAANVLKWEIERKQEKDFVDFNSVLMTNRWCRATKVSSDGFSVSFTGVYPDGMEVKRAYPKDVAWLVRKDLKLESDERAAEERRERARATVLELFWEVLRARENLEHCEDRVKVDNQMEIYVGIATEKVMKLF
jgi:hypothetical protein